jgi:hypothetical protein
VGWPGTGQPTAHSNGESDEQVRRAGCLHPRQRSKLADVEARHSTELINRWVEAAASNELSRLNRANQDVEDRAAEAGRRIRAEAEAAAQRRADMAAAWIAGADTSPQGLGPLWTGPTRRLLRRVPAET